MRILILGVSTLALGACSMAGNGWGHKSGHHHYSNTGHYNNHCVVKTKPCVVKPVRHMLDHHQAPVLRPAPVYKPAPVHSAKPCVAHPCSGGSYAVSPYAPAALKAQTPSAHAYGTHAPAYGYKPALRGPVGPKGQFYGTLGAALVDVDQGAVALQGRLGYQATEFFGAELEGSVGIISDKEDLGGGDEIRRNVDYGGALFATARYPVSDRVNVFARGGYHVTEAKETSEIAGVESSVSETVDDFAYGAGAEFAVSPRDSIRADYTRYEGGSSAFGAQDSVSLSWLRRF